jgi:hypothetical protein
MRSIYIVLFILGTLFPMVCFGKHFGGGSADAWAQFWAAPFASWVISGFSWDLIITASACTTWMIVESRRLKMGGVVWQVLLVFAVGMSCSLPLFLFRRETRLRARQPEQNTGPI